MSILRSLGEGTSNSAGLNSNTFADIVDATASTDGMVGKKFNQIKETIGNKKLEWFLDEARVDKYLALKAANDEKPSWQQIADNKLREMAMHLNDEEERAAVHRVDRDLRQMYNASKNAADFKQYYFDNLVPINQENTNSLLRKGVLDPIERERQLQQKRDAWRGTSNLTLKLLLSSIADASSGFLSKWLVMQVANKRHTYGLNHAALQIGPYLFDWNTSEIVLPRTFRSRNVVLLIPINDVCVVPKTESNLLRISEFITEWNRNWKYSRDSSNNQKKVGNCQHFVECLLQELRIQPSWQKNGPIENYIGKLKSNALGGETLRIWDKQGEHEFQNHKALVEYYENFARSEADARIREEFRLILKSIERCMMFRYWATKDERYKVLVPVFNVQFQERATPIRSNSLCVGEADNNPDGDEEVMNLPQPEVTGKLTV